MGIKSVFKFGGVIFLSLFGLIGFFVLVLIGYFLIDPFGYPKSSFVQESNKINFHISPWKSAFVHMNYRPRIHSGHGSSSPYMTYTVVLNDGLAESRYFLSSFNLEDGFGKPSYPGNLNHSTFKKMTKANPLLRASPDEKTLLVSFDEGKSWNYLSLEFRPEAHQEPFFCPHQSFAGMKKIEPEWSKIPPLKAWVLSVLDQKDPPITTTEEGWKFAAHLAFNDTPHSRFAYDQEVNYALQYAALHLEDADFRHAVMNLAVSPHSPYLLSKESDFVISVAQKVLERDPALFRMIEEVMRSEDATLSSQRDRGADILQKFTERDVKEILTTALEKWFFQFSARVTKLKQVSEEESKNLGFAQNPRWPFAAEWMLCSEGDSLTKALALQVFKAREIKPSVEQVLAKVAEGEGPCEDGDRDRIKINAIFALSIARSGLSKSVLEKVAQEKCVETFYKDIPEDFFNRWGEGKIDYRFPACYAKKFLSAR